MDIRQPPWHHLGKSCEDIGHPPLSEIWAMRFETWCDLCTMRWEALWPARDVKVWEGGGWEGGWPRRGDPGLSRLVSPSQELSSYGHQRTDFLLQQQQGKQHNSGRHQKFVKTASLPGLPLAISISYQEFVDLARIVNFWRLMLHWIYSLLYLHSFLSHVKSRTFSSLFKKLDWQREKH